MSKRILLFYQLNYQNLSGVQVLAYKQMRFKDGSNENSVSDLRRQM
jgi:hypothetical protein